MSKKLVKSNPYLRASDARERLIQNVASSTAIESGKPAKTYIECLRANTPLLEAVKRECKPNCVSAMI